jgi:hypothetical protein
MRRILPSLIALFLTFVVGTAVVKLRFRFGASAPISLCTIARHPDNYDHKSVRVRASADVISSDLFPGYITIYDLNCAPDDPAGAVVELSESNKLAPAVDAFVNDPTREVRKAEVIVSGVFDQWATMGCFTPRFGLHDAKVELVSPVTAEPLPTRESRVVR